jgi:hypothetical protein
MVVVEIDEKSPQAQKVLDLLGTFPFVKKIEENNYSKDFIKKIKKSEKQKRFKVDANNLWESLL